MSIWYKMVRKSDSINPVENKKSGYVPLVVRKSTVSIQEIAEKVSYESTINPFEFEASIRMFLHHIEDELLHSNHVCLKGFGTFSLTAESRMVEHPDEIRAESINVKRVVFKPSRILMKRIKDAKFVRVIK